MSSYECEDNVDVLYKNIPRAPSLDSNSSFDNATFLRGAALFAPRTLSKWHHDDSTAWGSPQDSPGGPELTDMPVYLALSETPGQPRAPTRAYYTDYADDPSLTRLSRGFQMPRKPAWMNSCPKSLFISGNEMNLAPDAT